MIFSQIFGEPLVFVIFLIVIVASLSFHEFSHALVGTWQGDDTAKRMGRLTLNPRAHLDLMGSLTFLIAGIGWAKPVPFNPYNLRNKKWGPSLVAFAGPISNLLLTIVSALALHVVTAFTSFGPENALVIFLLLMMQINLLLMIFNLIPIPPLDGSKFLLDILKQNPAHHKIVFLLETRGPMYLILAIVIDSFFLNSLIFGTIFGTISSFVLGLLGF